MKLITILLLASLLQVSAASFGQKLNLKGKDISFDQVFREIRKQTGYNVLIISDQLKSNTKIDVHFQDASLDNVMRELLKGKNLDYSIDKQTIVVKENRPSFLDRVVSVFADTDVRGVVRNEKGEPLEGISVTIKGTERGTKTNEKGEFLLKGVSEDAILVFNGVAIENYEVKVSGKKELDVNVQMKQVQLEEVTVNTGYYQIPKERATGSFDVIDNKVLNRRVSTNILDRIDGVASGLIFNKLTNAGSSGNVPQISIRGRSTLFANTEPLVILDNFPYQGGLENINPNDIESVTILKDAAAASIWGAYSGNGVIVLTSKKGKRNQPANISFNTNLTLGEKPNLFYPSQLSSADFIDVEKFLFKKGYYDVFLDYVPEQPQSPAVEILDLYRKSIIDSLEAERRLGVLGQQDVRNPFSKYFYQTSINQQYNLNISGGGLDNQYYLSAGYDNVRSNAISDKNRRFTATAQVTNHLLNSRLEINTRVLFANAKSSRPSEGYFPRYPYEQFIDANGRPSAVVMNHRLSYLDTLSRGNLLDWHYYPLNEREANSLSDMSDYKLDVGLSYRIVDGLKVNMNYQYGKGFTTGNTITNETHYSYRHLYNQFTSITPGTGVIVHALPKGSINSLFDSKYSSSFFRSGLSFNRTFSSLHNINGVAGFEVRKFDQFRKNSRLYGYDPLTATHVVVDHTTEFPQFFGGFGKITNGISQGGAADRSRSYYVNASYAYNQKYIFSASARKDESNLFGVKANQKGIPLWSAGISWELSKEPFYHFDFVPYLRTRFTYGYNGNVDKSAFASTTIFVEGFNFSLRPIAEVSNPANPSLQWERVKTINASIDFGLKNDIVSGSIEWYSKKGLDLIGYSPVPPQLGVSKYRGNVASTVTKGIDLILTSKNRLGVLQWKTDLLFSFVNDKITKNQIKQANNQQYADFNSANPLEGKPYAALYSFRWEGLDSTGDPLGYLQGKITKDYSQILNSKNTDELVYSGSFLPTRFGSLRNTLGYKQVELSFNILYKGDYYFRKEALQYGTLFGGGYRNQEDYPFRWQSPGDELKTNVPAAKYPYDPLRDAFYKYAEVNVIKGDHIRFQDIQISYELSGPKIKRIGFSSFTIYSYLNNICMIWKANKEGIDPDAGSLGRPAPRTYSIGIRANFK